MTTPLLPPRPESVTIMALDPFDHALCCAAKVSYSRRKAAMGFYSRLRKRTLKAAVVGCPQILEDRTPISVTVLDWKP